MIKKHLHIILLFLCAIIFAQEPIRFTTKQGLPSNHIYDMQEDENGFMWFATNRGLVKYDGETFKTFTIKDGLPNNDTWLLETDYQKRMWYFSKSKYQGYIKNDNIYKFPTDDGKVISPRFIFKNKKRIWLSSNSGYQTLKNDTLKKHFYVSGVKSDIHNNNIKEAEKKYDFSIIKIAHFINPEKSEILIIKQNEILYFDYDFNLISSKQIKLPNNHRNYKIGDIGLLYHQIIYYAMDRGILFINANTKATQFYNFKELTGTSNIKYFRCKGLQDEIQVSFPGHLLTFNYDMEFKESYPFPKELS